MIFTNLAGTTSNTFKVGSNSNGQILSNNAYDFFWNTPDPISGAQNLNVRTLGPGNNIFDLKDVGQYCCTLDEVANQILNMPKQTGNLAFLLLVEPSIGYDTQYIKYTMRFRNGEMWICERDGNTTFIAWERYAWANEIPVMPTLHAVATSGDYNSLANKPNIPNIEMGTWYANNNSNVALYNPNFFYTKFFGFVRLWGWFSAQGVPNTVVTISNLPFPVATDTMGLASMPFVSDVNKAYSMIGAYSTVEAASNSLSFEAVLLPANDTFAANEPIYKIISNGIFFVMFDITYKLK